MPGGLSARLKLPDKNGEQRAKKGGDAEQPEAIQEGQHRRLLLHDSVDLPQRAQRSIGGAVSVLDQPVCDSRNVRVERLIEIRNVTDEHRLVILRATGRD